MIMYIGYKNDDIKNKTILINALNELLNCII